MTDHVIYLITGPKNLRYVGITKIGLTTDTNMKFCGELVEFEESPCSSLDKRFNQHCRSAKNKKTPLQKAMTKYGVEYFSAKILEVVSNRETALKKERMYMITEKSNLNTIDAKTATGYLELMQEMISELIEQQKKTINYAKGLSQFAPENGREKNMMKLNKNYNFVERINTKLEFLQLRMKECGVLK